MPDETHLEAQVNAMLAEWAADINDVPEPSRAVLERVKAAVRHEVNEQWLADQPAPIPSEQAMRRTRRAVHQALGRSGLNRGRLFNPQMIAGLTAAAMLAACVGLIRYVGYLQPATSVNPMLAAAQEHVDLFVESAEYALATDAFSESVLDELDLINAQLAGTSQEEGFQSVLDELDGAIQEMFDDPEGTDDIMGSVTRSQGVLG
jgi:hypothetical protein